MTPLHPTTTRKVRHHEIPQAHARSSRCRPRLLRRGLRLARSNPNQKGPDPTQASIEAVGPYAVSTRALKGSGFGSGMVYSPNAAGSYALVAVCPGFVSAQSSIAQISRRLATHGFVVVTIDTNTFDSPQPLHPAAGCAESCRGARAAARALGIGLPGGLRPAAACMAAGI